MRIEVAVGKIGKWATSESGDTLEMIERPHGGISFVLVDGQRSGRAAKAISRLVARKTISELGEGIRDGAAARAAHDYLYAHRAGKVSATLNILSVDLTTNTLVVSRNSHCPVIWVQPDGEIRLIDQASDPIGVRRRTKPQISELPLVPRMLVVAYTDGLEAAGMRSTPVFDVSREVERLIAVEEPTAKSVADGLLHRALELDQGRPQDDISVLALQVSEHASDGVRRLHLSLPLSHTSSA
jgi:serine phosphatase RsbU (regulator of sigma subunit)